MTTATTTATYPEATPEALSLLAGLLTARGVELRVGPGGDLQLRDPDKRLTTADRRTIRHYRDALADWLTAAPAPQNATPKKRAAPPPGAPRCTRCNSTDFHEVTIHDGASLRRDCARCGRTWGFPVWHGAAEEINAEADQQ